LTDIPIKIFVIYGNSIHDFGTLTKIIKSLSDQRYQVTVQHGFSNPGSVPANFHVFDFCEKDKFINLISVSDLIITHAGVGSISAILKQGKMPFVMVRDPKKNEHVNDHQREFVDFYSADGIFIEVKLITEIIDYLNCIQSIPLPTRKYITNLESIRSDLFSYIDKIFHD